MEQLYVAAVFVGKLLELLVRVVFWTIVGLVVIVGFLLLVIFGTTKAGRRVEYHTRPD